jgi:hypothetical protein
MKSLLKRRPTPAFVVAIIALFVSMGGVSYGVATGSIDGREIKNNSVTGKDLRGRSLDGTDIKVNRVGGNAVKEEGLESSKIGKVPSATAADNAAAATALGGKSAADLDTRWALINESGAIEAQTGGFALVNCYQANANCYLDAGEDVRNNGIHAQISVANTDGSSILSGETGAAACGATTVLCAPPGTETNNVLVVAPRTRDADGDLTGGVTPGTTPPPPADAARFYVFVTGSQSQ